MGRGKPSTDKPIVKCFFSHKCDDLPDGRKGPRHEFADRVHAAFASHGIDVLIDPFGPGVEIGPRIRTIEFHALLFLSCQQSVQSLWCLEELAIAREKLLPVFAVRWNGEVPQNLRGRVLCDPVGLDDVELEKALSELAQVIRVRGVLYQKIMALDPENTPQTCRTVAQSIFDEDDSTALAEFFELLDRKYNAKLDETARYWIALAVGETRDPSAADMLERWRAREDHPLPIEGICQALRTMARKPLANESRPASRVGTRTLVVFAETRAEVTAVGRLSE